jgi:hypothetical protein
MNKRFLFTLALVLSLGLSGYLLSAQQSDQSPSQSQPSDPSAQQPQQPSQQQQAPDSQAQSQSPSSSGQVFTGTVVKAGDKYVLQSSNGTSYDVDDQAALKKYEGKQVRINGTLDPDGKTIHVK